MPSYCHWHLQKIWRLGKFCRRFKRGRDPVFIHILQEKNLIGRNRSADQTTAVFFIPVLCMLMKNSLLSSLLLSFMAVVELRTLLFRQDDLVILSVAIPRFLNTRFFYELNEDTCFSRDIAIQTAINHREAHKYLANC